MGRIFSMIVLLAMGFPFCAAGAVPVEARTVGYRRLVFQNGKEAVCEITASGPTRFRMRQAESEAWVSWDLVREAQAVSASAVHVHHAEIHLAQGNRTKAVEAAGRALAIDPAARLTPELTAMLRENQRREIESKIEARARGVASYQESMDRIDYETALKKMDELLQQFPEDEELLTLALDAEQRARGADFDLGESVHLARLRSVNPDSPLVQWAEAEEVTLEERQAREAELLKIAEKGGERRLLQAAAAEQARSRQLAQMQRQIAQRQAAAQSSRYSGGYGYGASSSVIGRGSRSSALGGSYLSITSGTRSPGGSLLQVGPRTRSEIDRPRANTRGNSRANNRSNRRQ